MDRQGDQSDAAKPGVEHSPDYAPYPKLDPKDVVLPPVVVLNQENSGTSTTDSQKSGDWSSEMAREPAVIAENQAATMPPESNPYISASPAPTPHLSVQNTVGSVRDALERWGKKVGEATKKAEDLAGNVWQHLKTAPSVTDAAMGRIAQSTKVLAEGGYEKIFQQTFETVPGEQLQNSYACYLSTSAGPIMGILYISTAKVAFCSDNPLSYNVGDQIEWSYYKVVIPLHQLSAVNPSASRANPAEKYIQVISVDNHEFWFMGFVNYDDAVKHVQEALRSGNLHSI